MKNNNFTNVNINELQEPARVENDVIIIGANTYSKRANRKQKADDFSDIIKAWHCSRLEAYFAVNVGLSSLYQTRKAIAQAYSYKDLLDAHTPENVAWTIVYDDEIFADYPSISRRDKEIVVYGEAV